MDYTDESSDSDTDPGTGASPRGRKKDETQDFSGYIDTPGNQDLQDVQEYELPDEAQAAPQPRREPEQPEPRG